jgi:signal transduction histidine kinase
MLAELTRVDAGWPLAISLAAAVAAQGLLAGRRRTALNEALHELRRPLQGLVLAAPAAEARGARVGDLPRQTALALERLDREINGGQQAPCRAAVRAATLLETALDRSRLRAESAGASLRLRAGAEDAIVIVDRSAIDRALDNLLINAIEHGGPRIVVGARVGGGVLRLTVADPGRVPESGSRRPDLSDALVALSGRKRHGHGLRVVRRVAAAHGGAFHLRRLPDRTEALLELPLQGGGKDPA